MALPSHYTDPRLTAIYDTVCAGRRDTGFYVELADELPATNVVDIGCGTGELACELVRRGHQVTGVDPAPAMLEVARHRPFGQHVDWIDGDASAAYEAWAGLAIMTGHAAQVFLDDEGWRTTLSAIRTALRPGGRLAFETRNPDEQGWTKWTPEVCRRSVNDPVFGQLDFWHNLLGVNGDRVRFEEHYLFEDSGDHLVSVNELRFPSQAALLNSLVDTGFEVERVFGDWDRNPVDPTSLELIFVAKRL